MSSRIWRFCRREIWDMCMASGDGVATKLFELAFPKAKEIRGSYFWHPSEPPLKMGNENVLTSLPVWYDPDTLTGRGIGGLDEKYYRNRFERYSEITKNNSNVNLSKLRAQAFAAPVFSAPLLNSDGSILDLADDVSVGSSRP